MSDKIQDYPDILALDEAEEAKQQQEDRWFEQKSDIMERRLGQEHDVVMVSSVPFEYGGPLPLYYYPNDILGTGIASKSLSLKGSESVSNEKYQSFELLMFTKNKIDLESAYDTDSAFGQAHLNISNIINPIAEFAQRVTLNPYETCEFPEDLPEIGGKCLIFHDYRSDTEEVESFGLMLVMEIFPSELAFARRYHPSILITLLTEHGVYPYSDLNREPVV